jgi:hypothetical protein
MLLLIRKVFHQLQKFHGAEQISKLLRTHENEVGAQNLESNITKKTFQERTVIIQTKVSQCEYLFHQIKICLKVFENKVLRNFLHLKEGSDWIMEDIKTR